MQVLDFRSVAVKYKAIFFDAYGVLKNHNGVIPGIIETFQFLRENDIRFYVLTNDASRSPGELAAYYQRAGVHCITEDRVVSSGLLAREYLRSKIRTGRVAYLGPESSAHYIATAGLETTPVREVDLEDASDLAAIVLLDDEGFDWERDLNKTVNLLRRYNIPTIVANTDFAYPTTRHDVSIAIGGLAKMLEAVVKRTFIRFGKPDSQIFHFAQEHIFRHEPVAREDILMVGDTLVTDILGANHFGIDTALVLTGNTLPDKASMWIEATGIVPNYICPSIV